VEKGCGKYIGNVVRLSFLIDYKCGDLIWDEVKNIKEIKYCPSCLAKLSILTEYDKSIKEMIEIYITKWKALNKSKFRTVDIDAVLNEFEGLLSKIGDVQQSQEKRNEK
jgi:hypothetical protein